MLYKKIILLIITIINIRCTVNHTDLIKKNPKDGKIYNYLSSLNYYYIENPESYKEWEEKNKWRVVQVYYDKLVPRNTGYYDYFYHKISIYNFGIYSTKEVEIKLDEYCPSITNRYITLERPFSHNLFGYFLLRLYNRTDYIIRCHY